jgi:hypothetical protein
MKTIKILPLNFSNGYCAGYYLQDEKGVNWAVQNSPKEAYKIYASLIRQGERNMKILFK